jgi:hypothetical protein
MRHTDHPDPVQRVRRAIADSYDEEPELELDDRDPDVRRPVPQTIIVPDVN